MFDILFREEGDPQVNTASDVISQIQVTMDPLDMFKLVHLAPPSHGPLPIQGPLPGTWPYGIPDLDQLESGQLAFD